MGSLHRGLLKAVGALQFALMMPGGLLGANQGLRPNVTFIMADDLGPEWVSCYGGEDIETPVLDKLAATGMRFTAASALG